MNYPICSMYGIFTYIWVIFRANVGKYSSTMEHMGITNMYEALLLYNYYELLLTINHCYYLLLTCTNYHQPLMSPHFH